MDFFSILTLVGGLAMFLYGMQVMGDGLEKLSGGKLEKILENLSSNRVKAVLVGAAVTAIIQSSSATHSYGSRLRKLGNHASVPGCGLYYGRKYRYYCYRMDSQPGRN